MRKSKYPKDWEDAFKGKKIEGYWASGSEVRGGIEITSAGLTDKSIFKTEKQVKSVLAYAQITQLMALDCYNGDWEPDYNNESENKYGITRVGENLVGSIVLSLYSPIAFKSREARDAFLKNHEELLKQYFQL